LALLVSMVAVFSSVGAAGAADTIKADLDCCTFAPGPYFQDLGEIPTFENPVGADAPHNVASTVRGPDGGSLFRSQTIGAGSTSPVRGTQYLDGGTYPFFCTLHGLSMSGELVVEGDKGMVVPRPAIRVTIPSQRLKAVRRSGTIKVSVRALTESAGVSLSAKRGNRSLGSVSGVQMSAGATKTVRLRLTRAGRTAVSKGRKVAISVKGSVAFGSPSSAKRTVR
jgi:plastocyanin